MATKFQIVEMNTAPAYVLTCTRDGSAIDLSSATDVSLIIQRKSDRTITQAGRSAVITTPSAGIVSYTALAADFPTSGNYVADVKVTYSNGGVEILFNQAKFKVRTKIQ